MSRTADQRVIVYVNGSPRRLFLGMRARHAVGHRLAREIECGSAILEDDEGNQVDLDGAVYDQERLIVRPLQEVSSSWPADKRGDAEGTDAGPQPFGTERRAGG